LTRKPNHFEADLLFLRQMEGVCSAQVQAQNEHSRGERDAMKKNVFCLALGAMLFALCFSAEAQQPKEVFRIGYLSPVDAATDSPRADGIRLALRELGYIDGQNIAIESRFAEGKNDRLPGLATELVRLKVDIIVVAAGDVPIQAAKNATKTIPIVMMSPGSDPVRAGHVESLARPGGNVTGLTMLTREIGGKRLELLKEAVPKLSRVAVLYHPAMPGSLHEVKELLPADARALKLTIQPWEIRAVDDFDKVFAALNKERPDGLYPFGAGPVMRPNQKRIVGFALKSRLPSVWSNRETVDAGGLMSYGADNADSYRRVAYYVDKILKGAKPADLPVEQPTKFELVINLKTAKQIGLTIPPNVLARADKVFK
jgi:putative ABC transport system substrate-binding protein